MSKLKDIKIWTKVSSDQTLETIAIQINIKLPKISLKLEWRIYLYRETAVLYRELSWYQVGGYWTWYLNHKKIPNLKILLYTG